MNGSRRQGGRDASDELWASGPRAVAMALDAGRVTKVYALHAAREAASLAERAKARGLAVEFVPKEALFRLVGPHHQGVAARLSASPTQELGELLDAAFEKKDPVIVVLDHLQDPHNVGAVARSAEAFGARGLVLARHRAAGLTPGAMKASAGALSVIPTTQVANIAQAIEVMKERGMWVVAADPEGEVELADVNLKGPVAVVIGGEGEGVSRLVRERSDVRARLATGGAVPSLNASVAAGIFLYEAFRQRRGS